jgi:hypothetical protein
MAWHDVAERLEHRLLHAGMLLLQVENQALHALSLQAEVAARRTAAADNGQLALLRVETSLGFLYVDQRPDDDMLAVVGNEAGWHRLQSAGKEQIQQERFDEVVQMMTKRDLRCADL